MATQNEKYIQKYTRTSHKRWESMVLYALHYALRDVLIISQYKVGNYLIDAYIPALNLAIEIDEEYHVNTIQSDEARQRFVEKELKCKFERVDVRRDVYQQVDNIVDLVMRENIDKWQHIPKPKNSGMFATEKQKGLENAGSYEFTESLRDDFDNLGFMTNDCEIVGHIPESNGYLGFMVNMDGIEFSISITQSNKPKVLITGFASGVPEKLNLNLDGGNKNGEYYNILNFKGQKEKSETISFMLDIRKNLIHGK